MADGPHCLLLDVFQALRWSLRLFLTRKLHRHAPAMFLSFFSWFSLEFRRLEAVRHLVRTQDSGAFQDLISVNAALASAEKRRQYGAPQAQKVLVASGGS